MSELNIVFILTDHFRRDYIDGSTPHLRALMGRGTTFTNAYCASPLCQPARNSIITGMHPTATGICGNQASPIEDSLRRDVFMRHLQAAGYHTALIGKHHYIDHYGIGMDVTEDDASVRAYGFDDVAQVVDDGENLHNDDRYTKHLADSGRLEEFRRIQTKQSWSCGPHPLPADDTSDGFIGMLGVRFIESVSTAKPFYLNLGFVGPHPPYWHPGEQEPKPDEELAPKGVPDSALSHTIRWHYRQKCRLIDSYVGRLVEALTARGLLDNTVIIFTSDHGDMLGDFGIWDKRYFYEESVGVPLILAGGPIAAETRQNGARTSRALVSHLDLYPTILGLAGVSQPRDRRRPGIDLIQLLRGELPGHSAVVSELATAMMIRTGNWKLVFDPEAGGVQQLFNLVNDPGEHANLADVAGYEAVTADLVQQLLSDKIRRTQYTHVKEEQRLQRVHIA